MRQNKLKIEFHPRKLSNSHSKQKFSPYRVKSKKNQNDIASAQIKAKLQLNQPLIKFHNLIDPNITKKALRLNNHAQKKLQEDIIQIQRKKQFETHMGCKNCLQIINKIDEQTYLLKQNLKEINKASKLPSIGHRQDFYRPQNDQHQQNQRIIIDYLDQLRNQREEILGFSNQNYKYQQEIVFLKQHIIDWQQKYKQIHKELNKCKKEEQIRSQNGKISKICKDANTSAKSIQDFNLNYQLKLSIKDIEIPTSNDQMKSILSEMIKKQNSDFLKIMNELQQIKLENEMLREQINLLNFAINEKDIKIQNLKSQLCTFINNFERGQKKVEQKIVKPILKDSRSKQSKKQDSRSMTISIDIGNESKINKKTNSITLRSKSQLSFENISIYSKDYMKNHQKMTKTISFSQIQEQPSNIYQQLPIPQSLFKIKKQQTLITKHQKQLLKKQKKQLEYFSQCNMDKLDLVRRTLNHCFKGFKCTYQQIQTILLQLQSPSISYYQIDTFLSEYPLSLCRRLKQLTLQYIFRQSDQFQRKSKQISCDLFSNRLRELIPDIQQIEEEQQLVLMENIKKKIYMCHEQMIEKCSQVSDFQGFINEELIHKILIQLKFSKPQINLIINQCCLLSSDADHLNYKHYLSIFKNDE